MLKVWIMITEHRVLIHNYYLNFFHVFVNICAFCILFTKLFAKTKYSIAKRRRRAIFEIIKRNEKCFEKQHYHNLIIYLSNVDPFNDNEPSGLKSCKDRKRVACTLLMRDMFIFFSLSAIETISNRRSGNYQAYEYLIEPSVTGCAECSSLYNPGRQNIHPVGVRDQQRVKMFARLRRSEYLWLARVYTVKALFFITFAHEIHVWS